MKQLTSIALFLFLSIGLFSQSANEVLDKVRKDFSSESSFQASFHYTAQYPEMDDMAQSGTFLGLGDKFNLKMDDQMIISNGSAIYIHLINEKEVQIMDLLGEGEQMIFTPSKLIEQYSGNDYTPRYVGVSTENGNKVEQIEFIPVDKNQDVFKVRITVKYDNKHLMRIKSFSKDGSRQVLELSDLKTNVPINSSAFAFNPADYPGVHVEDLR